MLPNLNSTILSDQEGALTNPGRHRRSTEILSLLLEKADVQGYLTTEDLMEVYPDVSDDVERFDAIVMALRRRGVDILDPEATPAYEEPIDLPSSDMDRGPLFRNNHQRQFLCRVLDIAIVPWRWLECLSKEGWLK